MWYGMACSMDNIQLHNVVWNGFSLFKFIYVSFLSPPLSLYVFVHICMLVFMAFDVVSFMRLCVSCYGLYGQIKFIP